MRRLLVLICAVSLADCGGSHPAATRDTRPTLESTMCASFAVAGKPPVKSCTLVLGDGESFSCRQPFNGPPPTAAQLERAGCRRVASLKLSGAERAMIGRLHRTRSCLAGKRLRVLGGAVLPPDPSQPGGEVVVSLAHPTFIAFYTDAGAARRLAPAVVRDAARTHASVERRGATTIVWTIAPASALRDDVHGCLSS
jgi:hypothetical protein